MSRRKQIKFKAKDTSVYRFIVSELSQKPELADYDIYSMWNGYLEEGENQKEEYVKIKKLFNDRVERLHTSGDATSETLAEVCNLVNPTTAIIPIHSEKSDMFRGLPISEELRSKIVTTSDIKENLIITISPKWQSIFLIQELVLSKTVKMPE